jgi:hypothetical protein
MSTLAMVKVELLLRDRACDEDHKDREGCTKKAVRRIIKTA